MKTVVLGIGNTLLGDEGAGIHALKQLQSEMDGSQCAIDYIDGGTLSFTLMDQIHGADNLIIIDAAELNQQAGSVKVFENEAMDDFVRNGNCSSVHEVSISELMDIALLTDSLPHKRALIGIQPHTIDWAESPSQPVAQGINHACDCARDLLGSWCV